MGSDQEEVHETKKQKKTKEIQSKNKKHQEISGTGKHHKKHMEETKTSKKKNKAKQEISEQEVEGDVKKEQKKTEDNMEGRKEETKTNKKKQKDNVSKKVLGGKAFEEIHVHASGVSEDQIEALINQDFDSEEFDKQMEAIFNKQYYDQAEDTHPYPEKLQMMKKKKK
eukprot:Phypoly_transcript_08757.p1 GENE.Phypoly_transcript_08757~~Phypoly_transcript_08757.p1  ORF type:complete len:168 (+),score=55.73 Phypoly_transcript_08757:526-1029(+)